MASQTGICINAAGCTLAYTKQPITVGEGGEFRCPECGQALQETQGASGGGGGSGKKSPVGLIVAVLVVVLLIGAGAFFGPKMLSHGPSVAVVATPAPSENSTNDKADAEKAAAEKADAEKTAAAEKAAEMSAKKEADERAAAAKAAAAAEKAATKKVAEEKVVTEPPVTPTPAPVTQEVEKPPLVENKEENADVKKQVLQRIDLMPDLSAANKSMLTTAVERARGMYKLSIINFESGGVAPSPAAVGQLVEGLHSPDVQKLLGDPTAVLIILGYADTKGNPDTNLKISQQRAKSLEKALSNQGKIKNAMHAVGMGSSEMFGEKQSAKNRVVEIWAVLP